MVTISGFCIVLVALGVFQQAAGAFKVTDCAANKKSDAKLLSLSVDSCPDETAERCTFVKGQNATMTIEFEPTKEFSEANIAIKAVLHGVYIPFAFPGPKNACSNYGFDCPVKVGQRDQMKITIPVLRSYPRIKAVVHFEMTSERKDPIVCLEFPIALV